MRIAMTLLALALATTTACKKKETSTANTTGSGSAAVVATGSADMAGSAADMAGSGAGSDMGSAAGAGDKSMAKQAGNCPSTVLGSTTKAELKGKDVVVTVTSDDKNAIVAIQTRAEQLIKDKTDGGGGGGGSGAHDQKGSHGGTIGICPLHIPEGATAKAKKEKNGVAVTITPKDNAEALKTEIDGRITKAAEWVTKHIKPGDKLNMGGVGGGSVKEGMNHSGQGDGKGAERKKAGSGGGGGAGTGGGGGAGTGGGGGKGSGAGSAAK
jgi:hypothetical protein